MFTQLFKDPGLDFEARIALGRICYGAADAGEVLATLALVQDGNDETWIAAWTALGDRLAGIARAAAASGHEVSAAGAWLRAASAYAATLNQLACDADTTRLLPAFRKHRDAWSAFCQLKAPAWEPVAIPYEGTTMPGWFARPDASPAPRPTLIVNNGSDGPISDMYVMGGAGALARGYNVLFFDGPGQQSMLFERQVYFRPDWEKVITPVVDFLLARSDVSPNAICLSGVSQAGYWVPRALAFEHRIAAAVADPGVVEVGASWFAHLPTALVDMLRAGQQELFDQAMKSALADPGMVALWNFRSRPYGSTDPWTVFSAMERYRIDASIASRITTPLLITDPEGEQFWPGQSEQLAALTKGVSTLVRFTAAEGADLHCQPMARLLTDQRMFDWMDGVLAGRPELRLG